MTRKGLVVMRKKISFIGVGNMASAIIAGITSKNNPSAIPMSNIILYDKCPEKMAEYQMLGAMPAASVEQAVELADCIFLCVKPQNFSEVLPSLDCVENTESKLFVTIAAGISMQTVSDATHGARVVRVLPNTPIFVGKGVSAICATENVSLDDLDFVRNIFTSSGSVLDIDEAQMNRIIGVTSSSPAYVFAFIKAMLEGASEQGLVKSHENPDGIDERLILNSICDTIIGAAELMKASDISPEEQISRVASKGGTTERALSELDEYNFREGIVSAMKKCTQRADELGKK